MIPLRDIVLKTFSILPQTSLFVCMRFLKDLRPSEQLSETMADLVQEGLLIQHNRSNRLPPTYELSIHGKHIVIEDLPIAITKYQKDVIDATTCAELEFATNQQKAYDLCLEYHKKKKSIYLSTIMIQHHLQLSYSDCLSVLTELFKSNELEPIGFLWKIIKKKTSCKKRKILSTKLEAIQ